jgi:hypothetical protein
MEIDMLQEKNTDTQKNSLTNACKRWILTLGGVVIRIKQPDGVIIECDTPEEMAEALRHLSEERNDLAAFQRKSVELPYGTHRSHLWRAKTFQQFVDALGNDQKLVLAYLVKHPRATDNELRGLLKIESNKQLAGVLSGLSKRASTLNIPARSIFTIENERKAGKVEKTYVIAENLFLTAHEMNWPLE